MNTTAQLPSRTATTLITWVATLNIVWVAASAFALAAGHVTMVAALGFVIGLPVAIKATRSSNRRKATLRAAATRTTPIEAAPQFQGGTRVYAPAAAQVAGSFLSREED